MLGFCETCLERGRETPGKDRGAAGVMCDSCFQGLGEKRERRGESNYPPDNKSVRAELRKAGRDPRRRKRRQARQPEEIGGKD